jgi:Ca2+-binding RTX toxin-like protein
MAIINGNAGNNTLSGKDEADTINGFAGNDTITGGLGNDLARMGVGNDTFIWRFGDDSDTLRGQDGFDTLVIEDPDLTTITRDASRAIVFDLSGNVLDLDDVERVFIRALAGADGIFIDNLAGTDIKQVVVDLAGVVGGSGGDGAVDGVVRNGGGGNDVFNVALASGIVSITGPSAAVTIRNADKDDILEINGLNGNDAINASKLPGGVMQLSINGDAGNDTITGSRGADELDGGDGNDAVAGGRGNDLVDLGAGNDLFTWSVGDGRDTVNGGAGIDTVVLTGSSGAEGFDIQANSIFASLNVDDGVERVKIRALAGGDTIFVGSLAGTDVSAVDIDLAAAVSGALPDAASDTIIVDAGTAGDDVVQVAWSGGKIVVAGLTANLSIAHSSSNDLFLFAGNLGNDLYDASNVPAGKMTLRFEVDGIDTIFGSAGNDTVLCFPGGEALVFLGAGNDSFQGLDGDDVAHMGAGNDFLNGASGNDIGFLGAGNDTMDGGIGNDLAYLDGGNDRYTWMVGGGKDTVNGGAGIDTLQFNGGGASETIRVDAIGGGRVRVAHDASSGFVDLDDVERLRIRGYDGSDNFFVFDLTGTNVAHVAIDLAGAKAGASDGASDNAVVTGSVGNDLITLTTSGGAVSVGGLAAQVTVTHFDAKDSLGISASDGNDSINAVAVKANSVGLSLYGGDGRDTVIGSASRDTLDGGSGADLLRGGGGSDQILAGQQNDRLEGGAGKDILIGGSGDDVVLGGSGDDAVQGDGGNDTIIGGAGNDTIYYVTKLDGHDVILDFDGNPADGQDTLSLEGLFLNLLVAPADRAGRVSIVDKGATVDVFVDADGNAGNGFELAVATLHTLSTITVGQDVIVGT